MSRLSMCLVGFFTLSITLSLAVGCGEDLTEITKTWETTQATWNTDLEAAKTAQSALKARLDAVVVPAADIPGADLKAKATGLVEAHQALITEFESTVGAARTGFDAGVAEQKLQPITDALTAANTKMVQLAPAIAEKATEAGVAIDGVIAHLAAEAQKASAAGNNDAVVVKQQGGEAGGFQFVYAPNGDVDEEASAAGLSRLKTMLDTCETLRVELVATGVADAAQTRAVRLQQLLEKTHAGRVVAARGEAGDGSTKVIVQTPCGG